MEKQPKTKPRYNLWQNTRWMVRLGWKECRPVVVLTFLVPLIDLAVSLTELYVTPAILQQIESHVPLIRLTIAIILFLIGWSILEGLRSATYRLHGTSKYTIRTIISVMIQQKTLTISYSMTEDPAVRKRSDAALATTNSNNDATEAFWPSGRNLLRDLLGFAVYLALLSSLDPMLAAIVIVTALLGTLAAHKANRWEDARRLYDGSLLGQFRCLNGESSDRKLGKDLRLFGMMPWLSNLQNAVLHALQNHQKKVQSIHFWADLADVLLALARNGAAYWYLISMTLREGLPASTFLLYFTAVGNFSTWVTGILSGFTTMRRHSLDLCAVREYLDLPEMFHFEDGKPLPVEPGIRHRLELRDVSFRYPGGETDVLSHINLIIAPGEKLAIVGLNGAGKTTLIKLLCGFYDPTEGQVLLDGQDIRQYNRRDYYKHFAGVFQDYSLLEVSVRDNIVPCGQPCDQARLESCIEKAGLTEKIASLPKGYDTPCGRQVFLDGTDFSGGETQRLLLARALYRDSPILVLDEPTAALDPLAENDIYQKYNTMCAGKTSVYISHRLASTRFCDRILLLDQGVIAEEGTHDSLLAAGGKYAELFQVQSRYYEKGGDFREDTKEKN